MHETDDIRTLIALNDALTTLVGRLIVTGGEMGGADHVLLDSSRIAKEEIQDRHRLKGARNEGHGFDFQH